MVFTFTLGEMFLNATALELELTGIPPVALMLSLLPFLVTLVTWVTSTPTVAVSLTTSIPFLPPFSLLPKFLVVV